MYTSKVQVHKYKRRLKKGLNIYEELQNNLINIFIWFNNFIIKWVVLLVMESYSKFFLFLRSFGLGFLKSSTRLHAFVCLMIIFLITISTVISIKSYKLYLLSYVLKKSELIILTRLKSFRIKSTWSLIYRMIIKD